MGKIGRGYGRQKDRPPPVYFIYLHSSVPLFNFFRLFLSFFFRFFHHPSLCSQPPLHFSNKQIKQEHLAFGTGIALQIRVSGCYWTAVGSRARQDAIHFYKSPSKLLRQLGIWQLITPKSDVYEGNVKLCIDSPPVSNLQCSEN